MKVRKERFVFALVIILHVSTIIYWANAKTNYFIDELLSFGYASSFTGEGDTARYITESSDFQWNTWISNADFKKYLVVSEEEELLHAPVQEVLQRLLTGRNYFGFLNLAESVAGDTAPSVWPAIILNILFAVLTDLAFIALTRMLCMDWKTRILALAMFAFSGYMLSTAVYVRFYQLVILLMMLILNLFAVFWTSDRRRGLIPASLGMLMLTYFSYKNSEIAVAFFGALMGCAFLAALLLRKWRHLAAIGGMGIIGALYVGICTDYLNVLIHPNYYDDVADPSVSVGVSESIAAMDLGKIKSIIDLELRFYYKYFFATFWAALMFIAVVIAYYIASHRDSKAIKTAFFSFSVICCLNAYFFWHFDHVMMATANLIFAMSGLIFVNRIDEGRMTNNANRLSQQSQIVFILTGMAIVYAAFGALAGFQEWRYYWPVYPTAFLIFWYAIDRIIRHFVVTEDTRRLYLVLSAFVIINAMLPFATRDIMYLYEDDAELISYISDNNDMDAVLLLRSRSDIVADCKPLYDCVSLMSENANLYCVDVTQDVYNTDYPGEFQLWTSNEYKEITAAFDELGRQGYRIQELGAIDESNVYLCSLQEG